MMYSDAFSFRFWGFLNADFTIKSSFDQLPSQNLIADSSGENSCVIQNGYANLILLIQSICLHLAAYKQALNQTSGVVGWQVYWGIYIYKQTWLSPINEINISLVLL